MRALLPFDATSTTDSDSTATGSQTPASNEANRLQIGFWLTPTPGQGEVLVKVHATALNRADLMQMRGQYPPPRGASPVPGLECSGIIESLGPGVEGWQPGDRVMALLAGGGQAEWVAVPQGQLMPIPDRLDFAHAAALPEVAITAWTNLVAEGELRSGQTVLITAAASGVGSFAVQLARALGARVLVAGRHLGRLERLKPLGADACLLLDDSLPEAAKAANNGQGVDLVLELAGGQGLAQRLGALRHGGRLVLVGLLAGSRAEIDLGLLLRQRLRLIGSVLRARSLAEKTALVEDFWSFAAAPLAAGKLKPIIHDVRPFDDIAEAYADMAAGGVLGKLVLTL